MRTLTWNLPGFGVSRKTLLGGAVLLAYFALFIPYWQAVVLGFLFASASHSFLRLIRFPTRIRRGSLYYATLWLSVFLVLGATILLVLDSYLVIIEFVQNPKAIAAYSEKLESLKSAALAQLPPGSKVNGGMAQQLVSGFDLLMDSTKNFIWQGAQKIFMEMPDFSLNLFIFFSAFGAFLFWGPQLLRFLNWMFRNHHEAKARYLQFQETCSLTLGSIFLIGLIQALMVTLGAAAGGMETLSLIFLCTFIASLIPVVGAGTFGVLLSLMVWVEGRDGSALILLAVALLAGIADNILRAWLFSKVSKANPVISLISTLGALTLLGFPGLFIAPVLEQLAMDVLGNRDPKV